MSFGALLASTNDAIEEGLTDCRVTFGSSHAWAPLIDAGRHHGATIEDGSRVALRAMFEEPHGDVVEMEGYRPSVSFRTLVERVRGSFHPATVQRDDRLTIERDVEPGFARIVYRVTRVRHDGQGGTLCYLHALGPMDDAPERAMLGFGQGFSHPYAERETTGAATLGFGQGLGFSYAGEVFDDFVPLDVPRAA